MAYTGKKPTDFVDVTQTKDFTVTEDLTVGGAFASQGIDDNASSTAVTIDSSGNTQIKSGNQLQIYRGDNTRFMKLYANNSATYIEGDTNTNDPLILRQPNAAGTIRFETGGANERLRILSSGGITFNGDTAAANALGDYEEGTFTPTWNAGNTAGTYYNQFGYYTKVGTLVHFHIFLNWNNWTITINNIGGLPYAASNSNEYYSMINAFHNTEVTYPSGRTTLQPYVRKNEATLDLSSIGSGVASGSVTVAGTGVLYLTGSYISAT
jgi:hypothetical protein